MIEVAYLKENEKVKTMPHEVQETILGILEVLEEGYGKDRKYEDDGGYITIIEEKEDFEEL